MRRGGTATAPIDIVEHLRAPGDDEQRHRALIAHVTALPPDAALDFLQRLKDESERSLTSDTHAALRLGRALVKAAEWLAEPRHRAMGLLATGDALRLQTCWQEAVALYDEGGRACLDLGDRVGWARSRTGWVFASHYLGRGLAALPVADDAHTVLVEAKEWLRAGALSLNAAVVCYELGRYAEALTRLDRAVELYERARATQPAAAEERIARSLANKALVLSMMGAFDEAVELCGVAREVFARHGLLVQALRVDHYMASIYAGQGHYTRALKVYGEVLTAVDRAGLMETAVEITLDMVKCYAAINQHAEALELAQDLVRRCEAGGTPTEAAKARFYCAQALASLGDSAGALRLLEDAARTFDTTGLTPALGIASLLRARLYLTEEDWAAAARESQRAHALFAERGLVVPRAQAELVRAEAALAAGDLVQAAALARSALGLAAERALLPLAPDAHHTLARVAEAMGDRHLALEEYEAGVSDLERAQGRLATDLRTEFLGDKLSLYHDAIVCSLADQRLERALGYLERAKSRALVDYITHQPGVHIQARSPADAGLVEELTHLRHEHTWFYNRLYGYRLAASADEQPGAAESATLRTAIEDREKRIKRILGRLALAREADGLESLEGRASSQPYQRPRLESGTVLIEYGLREDDGGVFVLTAAGLSFKRLAIGTREIRRLLNRWQLNLDATARAVEQQAPLTGLEHNARAILQQLYQVLIAPVARYLAGMERLIVVPYGATHSVPFHALFNGQRHLIEDYEVSTCPSSSLLELCARRPRPAGGHATVVAYSDGGRLPHVLGEAHAVADLLGATCYVETEATRQVVIDRAAGASILHLAAHGEARLDDPTFAHLKLADGQLSSADVFSLRLEGALVTLSACETGRSAVVGGDELVGLSRGFLFAGASTLIQSLWRVEDDSTARLMQRFYQGVCQGEPAAAALRCAQRSLLEAGAATYAWAPFQLVGHDGRPR